MSYIIPVTYKLPPMAELEKTYPVSETYRVSHVFDGRRWERHASCRDIDETPGIRVMRVAEAPNQYWGRKVLSSLDELAAFFGRQGERFAIHSEAHDFACKVQGTREWHWIMALGSFSLDDNGDKKVAMLAGKPEAFLLATTRLERVKLAPVVSHLLLVRKLAVLR